MYRLDWKGLEVYLVNNVYRFIKKDEAKGGFTIIFGNWEHGYFVPLRAGIKSLQAAWRKAIIMSRSEGRGTYGDITLYKEAKICRSMWNGNVPILKNRELMEPYGNIKPYTVNKY